jgi:hypothetical protein
MRHMFLSALVLCLLLPPPAAARSKRATKSEREVPQPIPESATLDGNLAPDRCVADGEGPPATELLAVTLGTGLAAPLSSITSIVDLTSFNARVGLYVLDNFQLNFGFDVTSMGVTIMDTGSGRREEVFDENISFIGLQLGGKIHFTDRGKGRVSVYNQFGLFTMIPISSSLHQEVEDYVESGYAIGLFDGMGLEYFFSNKFSIGGELGLNLFFVGFDEANVEADAHIIDAYTGMTLNFYLL